ncbi:MAG TPA: LytR C-terminal domain-containing protein [Ilumatobacteraceae bacterium]|nr:LytR C-terminal domain-containing protein [Ilumatobacteraceae bacterium]
MSNDTPSRRPTGKSSSGAPMGSTVSIVIAVIAVVVGFLILKNINDGGGGGTTGGNNNTTTTTTDPTTNTEDIANTTTTSEVSTVDKDPNQIVVVANASGIQGAAGRYTTTLQGEGWTTGAAETAAQRVTASLVYFLPGGENVAASVAAVMSDPAGTPIVASAMPTPPPLEAGKTLPSGVTVLVMLGPDLADKPLPGLAAAGTSTNTTTTLPGAPAPNG